MLEGQGAQEVDVSNLWAASEQQPPPDPRSSSGSGRFGAVAAPAEAVAAGDSREAKPAWPLDEGATPHSPTPSPPHSPPTFP